ncbi:MAG: phasin family protein [Halopseudomonas sp.]
MEKQPIDEMSRAVQPLLDIAAINQDIFQRMTELQTEYMSHCLENSLVQFKSAIDCITDPQASTQSQLDYCKTMEHLLSETAAQEYQAIHQAHDKINQVLESSYKHHSRFLNGIYPNPTRPV